MKKQAVTCVYERVRERTSLNSHLMSKQLNGRMCDLWLLVGYVFLGFSLHFAFCDALNTATDNQCCSFHHNCVVQIVFLFLCSDQY